MLYLLIIFISAFLLFQVQPLIAKLILPFFGGGAAIWTACLLFFQAFLLLGYFYAHCITQLSSLKSQLQLHGIVLIVSLLFLPIGVTTSISDITNQTPLVAILELLASSIGWPYFILSSTAPLIQRWLTLVEVGKLPYKLYSLSNVGSLVALLSFPFIFEPLLSSSQQSNYWTVGYFCYVALLIGLLWRLSKNKLEIIVASNITSNSEPCLVSDLGDDKHILMWICLSAVGVVLLVSTTNAMTQNIPPVPFLWILPLSLYLLTFIINFHSPKWYVRNYWFALLVLTSVLALLMYFIGSSFDIFSQVVIYSCILFTTCIVCHGELASLKPKAKYLTLYYLSMSFGGFLGSAFVVFVAQNVFDQFFEYPLSIVVVSVLLSVSLFIQNKKLTWLMASAGTLAVCLLVGLWYMNRLYVKTDIVRERNFYGILSVKDVVINDKTERRLIDGTTSHGTQLLDPQLKNIPQSYYRQHTGVALALEQHYKPLKAGIVGLGAGTLAAYGRAGDHFLFYELNPAVITTAQHYFSYLTDSAALVDIFVGDGRVSLQQQLERSGSQQFDVLVIDAFSGDAIPKHLLTIEAFTLYFQHLKQDGILAIHISNTHLDLTPLMKGLAQQLNKHAIYFKTLANDKEGHDTQWVLITTAPAFINNKVVKAYRSQWPETAQKSLVWRDDYSNLLSVIK